MDKIHEVATLLQKDPNDWSNSSINDESYKRYTRLLRSYTCFAWYKTHTCWWCNEAITDYYEAYVYVARPAVFVPQLGYKATFWVEKRHYPECPDRLREFEEEMYEQWAKDDDAAREADRKAA